MLDFDAEGRVLGIEVLHASRTAGAGRFGQLGCGCLSLGEARLVIVAAIRALPLRASETANPPLAMTSGGVMEEALALVRILPAQAAPSSATRRTIAASGSVILGAARPDLRVE